MKLRNLLFILGIGAMVGTGPGMAQGVTRTTKDASNLDLLWTSVGPDNIGGRTRSVLIDQDNSNTIYAGSVSGGIFKSITGGSSWVPVTVEGTTNSAIAVTCMIQIPNGTIYAGTGEGWYNPQGTFGVGGMIGTGLYKSTDGNDFTPVSGTEDWEFINELCYDAGTNRLFLATNNGLWYSGDEQNWSLAEENGGGPLNGNATDICIGSNGIIIAVVDEEAFVSETGAVNGFVNQSTGASGKLPATNVGRMETAIAPSNPDVMYALAATTGGVVEGVYKSEDKGNTWRIIGPGNSNSFALFNFVDGGATTYVGLYNNTLAVHPTLPDVILVGGADLWQGTDITGSGFYAWNKFSSYTFPTQSMLYLPAGQNDIAFQSANNNSFYVATNAGVYRFDSNTLFQPRNKNYKSTQFYSVAASGQDVIMGGAKGAGTLRITGQGNTPEEAEVLFGGNGAVCAFSTINQKAHFISQPQGFLRRTVDNGNSWRTVLGSNMTNVNEAYIAPFLLWESVFDEYSLDSVTFLADTNYAAGEKIMLRSHNSHYPFHYVLPSALNQGEAIRVQDPVTARMFYGATGGLWMTDEILDFLADPLWALVAEYEGTTQALAATPDGDVLYAGTQEGGLFRLRNIKSYLNDSTPHGIILDTVFEWPDRVITSIYISPSNPNYMVVTLGNYGQTNHVYWTTNALAANPAFTSIQGDLPPMPVYASLIELNHPERIMIGTEMGIWSIGNPGTSNDWTHETNGIPDVQVFDLFQQTMQLTPHYIPSISGLDTTYEVIPGVSNYGVIYAATHGRGLFRCDNFVSVEEPEVPSFGSGSSLLKVFPNPAREQASLEFHLKESGQVVGTLFDIRGQSQGIVIDEFYPAGRHAAGVRLAGLSPGIYFIRMMSGGYLLGTAKIMVQ